MKNENKKNASISFDAAIPHNRNIVGIGIFDTTHNVKFHLSYNIDKNCSLTAETMALACALEYAYENNYDDIELFTDNKPLANRGIPDHFLIKYPFKNIKLSWIPRELNQVADDLSKNKTDYNFNTMKSANQTNKSAIKEMFSKYNYEQKVAFIKKMAKRPDEKEFSRMLAEKEKGDYKFDVQQNTSKLIRMAKLIFDNDEFSPYIRKRFKNFKYPDTGKKLKQMPPSEFTKEFNKRKVA